MMRGMLNNPVPANPQLFIKHNSSVVPLVDRILIPTNSNYYTLIPGDVVLTGTPEGVGTLRVGDKLEIRGLGEISTTCTVDSAG